MDPIVHGLTKRYRGCMKLERVNYHGKSSWHDLLFPVGSPEFALLDSAKNILYRWSGYTETDEFTAIIDPLCSG